VNEQRPDADRPAILGPGLSTCPIGSAHPSLAATHSQDPPCHGQLPQCHWQLAASAARTNPPGHGHFPQCHCQLAASAARTYPPYHRQPAPLRSSRQATRPVCSPLPSTLSRETNLNFLDVICCLEHLSFVISKASLNRVSRGQFHTALSQQATTEPRRAAALPHATTSRAARLTYFPGAFGNVTQHL
jgi:hypothetical protein